MQDKEICQKYILMDFFLSSTFAENNNGEREKEGKKEMSNVLENSIDFFY